VIEALASGIPLVIARGGPLESVTSAGFVEPRDPDALAREVVTLVRDDAMRGAMIEEGRALYARTFTPERVAAQYEDAYAP